MKNNIIILLFLFIAVSMAGCSRNEGTEVDALLAEIEGLRAEIEDLTTSDEPVAYNNADLNGYEYTSYDTNEDLPAEEVVPTPAPPNEENIQAMSELLTSLMVFYDEIDDIFTIVGHVDFQNTGIGSTLILERGEFNHPTLIFVYDGRSWIFFESVTIAMGENREDIDFPFGLVQREVYLGGVNEWAIDSSNRTADIMRGMAQTDDVTIRFRGDGTQDHRLTSIERNGITNILALYDMLRLHPGLVNYIAANS